MNNCGLKNLEDMPTLSIKTGKKLNRGEICVANFIPPVNGASQGKYFLPKILNTSMFYSIQVIQN